jgi:hypothetical protein
MAGESLANRRTQMNDPPQEDGDEMKIVRVTKTWVVEIPIADETLSTWRIDDVESACHISDPSSMTWTILDGNNLKSEDMAAITVWREYRDGKKLKSS